MKQAILERYGPPEDAGEPGRGRLEGVLTAGKILVALNGLP
jgi:hypothetical protein